MIETCHMFFVFVGGWDDFFFSGIIEQKVSLEGFGGAFLTR